MSEYRFVSFVPVDGKILPKGTLYRFKDRDTHDSFKVFPYSLATGPSVNAYEFIRPADSDSPTAEPVPATIQATPAMTVREQFAMAAMQEVLRLNKYKLDRIPVIAACIADTLIDEIERTKEGK